MKTLSFLGFLLLFSGSFAHAVTFDVTASQPFISTEPEATDTNGSVSGFFTIDDDGDGVIDAEDIVAWSFTGSGFDNDALNIVLSSDDEGALALVNNDDPVDIGAGLSVSILDFEVGFAGIQINFDPEIDLDIFNFNDFDVNPLGAFFTTSEVVVAPPATIPLPASWFLLSLGLAGVAALGRRSFAVRTAESHLATQTRP